MSISIRSTRAFLKQYREPTKVVRRAEEVVSLDDDELIRSVDLVVSGDEKKETFIEVLRPRKGQLAGLQIEHSSVPVARLGHDEHRDLAVQLICARWASVVRRIRTPPAWSPARQTLFVLELLAFLEDMKSLPDSSGEKARVVMQDCWERVDLRGTPTWVPAPFLGQTGLGFSRTEAELLYQLCSLFAERYSIILRAEASTDPLRLTYVYRQRIASRGAPPRASRFGWLGRWWRRGRAYVRSFFGARPATVRIHVPLARKAAQYTLAIDAPSDCFFWKAGLLTEKISPGRPGAVVVPARQGVAWASTINYGRRVSLFVDSDTMLKTRLFVGADLRELPSRSTFRAWSVASVVVLAITVLTIVGYAGGSENSDVAALVAALTGLASVGAAEVAPSRGVIGTPVLARLAFFSIPIIATGLAVWLVSLAVEPVPVWTGLPDVMEHMLVTASRTWYRYGGAGATVASFVLFLWLTVRIFRVGSKYRDVKAGRGDRNHLYG